MKARKVAFTSVAVVTMKFLFGMCNWTIASDVCTGDFALMKGLLYMCGHTFFPVAS